MTGDECMTTYVEKALIRSLCNMPDKLPAYCLAAAVRINAVRTCDISNYATKQLLSIPFTTTTCHYAVKMKMFLLGASATKTSIYKR